jgi:integrase
MAEAAISRSLAEFGELPEEVIDQAGRPVDVSASVWRLNSPTKSQQINWHLFPKLHPSIRLAAAKYIIERIKTKSPQEVHNTYRDILVLARHVERYYERHGISREIPYAAFSELRAELAKRGREYWLHRIRAWYLWAADNGFSAFSSEVAFELSQLKLPGNRKGTAVLSEDPEEGPLDEEEVVGLLSALRSGDALRKTTLQERVAVWLCFALGRNPGNYCLLLESDFRSIAADGVDAVVYELMVPRIKKRQAKERYELKRQKISAEIAALINQLIAENAETRLLPDGMPKWLFRRPVPHTHSINSGSDEFAFQMYVDEFTDLVRDCAAKLDVTSPRTGKPLKITTRRLRYTFATRLVDEGISARGLAEALDHSDLQHVTVYFNARSNIVRRIDAAIAMRVAPLAQAFAGKLVDSEKGAVRGADPNSRIFRMNTVQGKLEGVGTCGSFSLCGLGPPIACYTCRKFQPWRGARHQDLLKDLIADRDKKLEAGMDPKMVKLLDPTIYAVAEVVRRVVETHEPREGDGERP